MRRPDFERPFRSRAGGEMGLVDSRAFPARTFERTGQEQYSFDSAGGNALPEVCTIEDFRAVYGVQTFSGFSASFWFKLRGVPAVGDGIMYTGDQPGNESTGVTMGPSILSGLNCFIGSDSVVANRTISPAIVSGVWYHVAYTWNPAGGGSTLSGFLNASNTGWTNGTRTTAYTMETGVPLGVGHNFWLGTGGTSNITMRVYGVQIWNRPLLQADVTALYNAGTPLQVMTSALLSGLRLWWRLGDSYQERQRAEALTQGMSPPGIVRDLSGNGFHGTLFSRSLTVAAANLPDFVADVP